MGSIRRHRNAMIALLAEYNDNPSNTLDTTYDFDEYLYSQKRREDNGMQGDLCQSVVRYARPQKARSASGEWKYIVNTGQHTQTLRLEKCMNPQESCSYLATSYRSHCGQVYNYHRLLSWDKTRGLHVDIFKVPTCCSCQIDGYKQKLQLEPESNSKGFTAVYKTNLYRQQYDSSEEEDEDDDFDYAVQRKHREHDTSFNENDLTSKKIRRKVPRPTVGSYLSPPVNEEYEDYIYNNPRETASIVVQHNPSSSSIKSSSKHYLRELQKRRPYKFYTDSRSDQDVSPSEQHEEREVNVFGTAIGKGESNHRKRNNIYSVIQTANTSSSSISGSSTTAFSPSTGTIRAFTAPSTIRQRRPAFVDTNAHKKQLYAAVLPTTAAVSSSPAAAATKGTSTTLSTYTNGSSTIPTYYYARTRHVLKNQSKLRIPHTIPSTNTGGSNCAETNTTSTNEYENNVPTTTTTTSSSSSQQSDIYAVNQNIIPNPDKTKFSLTYTTTPTLSNSSISYPLPPKRINYNYHPIIDFFEYNKRIIVSSTTTTTPQPLMTATEVASNTTTHLYPHKINKPSSVYSINQRPQIHTSYKFLIPHNHQQHKQQLIHRPQQTEHEIGYGAAAAAVAVAFSTATDGDVTISRKNSGVVSHSPKQNTNFKINSGKNLYSSLLSPSSSSVAENEPPLRSNIWQPVIIRDF